MKLNTFEDLFVHELQDIYHAEQQLLKALPKMAKAASHPDLKSAFQTHLEETKGQIQRLERAFGLLGKPAKGEPCKGMEGLIEEGDALISGDGVPAVKDAGLIVAAQKVEHYEIAAYGSVCVFAGMLQKDEVKRLLKENLVEEESTDEKLTALAESIVNVEALT